MVNLAWEIGDGVIFYLRPLNEMKEMIAKMQSIKKIDVSCQIITCVSENSDIAVQRVKKTIAFYVSVGKVYRDFLINNGFKKESKNIFEEFQRSGLKSNHELVSDSMLHSLAIAGTPNECKTQFKKFTDVGIDLPIIQFNPVGNTLESFKLFKNTFLEE
jgi:alkanesulfonate monooxygenase SsuD/methylene tetrahydromethanopterin reductase-like flavin-dependent oxidoreductase (luciferase family)